MVPYETLSRIQQLHERRGASYGRAEGRDTTARSGVSKTGRLEPAKARTQTESQAFRGPRFKRPTLVDRRLFPHLAGKLGIRETLPGNLRNRQTKPLRVVHVLPGVVTKCLFVDLTEQVEWLNRNVSSVQAALQEAPEVLHPVGMNIAANVLYRVMMTAC